MLKKLIIKFLTRKGIGLYSVMDSHGHMIAFDNRVSFGKETNKIKVIGNIFENPELLK